MTERTTSPIPSVAKKYEQSQEREEVEGSPPSASSSSAVAPPLPPTSSSSSGKETTTAAAKSTPHLPKELRIEPATPLTPDTSNSGNNSSPPAPTPPAPSPPPPPPPAPPAAPKPEPPVVFDHESRLKTIWDTLQFINVCVIAVVVPLRIGFNVVEWRSWLAPDILVDLLLWIDLVLNCITTFELDGETVRDRGQILSAYVLSIWFWVDLLSCLPGEFAHIGVQEYTPLYRANRLIRCFRFGGFFRAWERSSAIKPTVIRLLKSAFTFLFFCHFIGCVYFIIVRVEGDSAQDDFVGMDAHDLLSHSITSQYFRSWYWAMAVMPGFNNTNPRTLLEVVFCMIVTLSGILFVATIIGAVGDMATNLDSSKIYFRAKMDEIDDYMAHRRLPKELQEDVQAYYNYLWKSGKALERNDLLVELPPYLKTKMNLFLNREIVTKVPLFKQAVGDERFISALIGCLRGIVCLPNFFVVRKGEFGTDMYFISRGELNVVGDNGVVVFTLRDGGFFGEIALLYDTKRTATIVARTYCDMFLLTKEDFKKVLRQFPEQSQGIKQIAQERFQKIVEDEKKKEDAAARARAEAAAAEAAQTQEEKIAEEREAALQREAEAEHSISRTYSMKAEAAGTAPLLMSTTEAQQQQQQQQQDPGVFHNGAPVELVLRSPKATDDKGGRRKSSLEVPPTVAPTRAPQPHPHGSGPSPVPVPSNNLSFSLLQTTTPITTTESGHGATFLSEESGVVKQEPEAHPQLRRMQDSQRRTPPGAPPLPPLTDHTPGAVQDEQDEPVSEDSKRRRRRRSSTRDAVTDEDRRAQLAPLAQGSSRGVDEDESEEEEEAVVSPTNQESHAPMSAFEAP